MKKFLLIIFVLSSISCFGQITAQVNFDNFDSYDSLLLKRKIFTVSDLVTPNVFDQISFLNKYESELKIPQSYFLPLLGVYKKDEFVDKFLLDMNLTNRFTINDINSITTSHIQSDFIGLGGLNLITGSYDIRIEDFGVISPGIYAAKFNIYNDFFNDAGLNGNIKIQLSDKIKVNFFGQFSNTSSRIAISPFISPIYPHSDFGGYLEFNLDNKREFMMGTENEYDVFLRKWVTRPYIACNL